MRVLVVNVGSSSIKYAAFDADRLFDGRIEDIRSLSGYDRAVDAMLDDCRQHGFEPEIYAHRVVHGFGLAHTSVFDRTTRRHIVLGCNAAPLHNIPQLRVLDELGSRGARQACVFDSLGYDFEDEVREIPLPAALTVKHGLHRIGFHGISHTSIHAKSKNLGSRIVTVHLGSGSSVTAWRRDRAVWNSMGFTPEDGVMMATRPGSIDPGTIAYLLRLGFTQHQVEDILTRESGLVGVAGTPDLKEVLDRKRRGNRYDLAFRMLTASIAETVARATVHAGGIDALVFSGTIGVRAGKVRSAVLKRLSFLGSFKTAVVGTDEEQVIYEEAVRLTGSSTKRSTKKTAADRAKERTAPRKPKCVATKRRAKKPRSKRSSKR